MALFSLLTKPHLPSSHFQSTFQTPASFFFLSSPPLIASTSMADKKNFVRVTRATKRRAAEAMTSSNDTHLQTPKTKRKRVILGEIPSNILASLNTDFQNEPQKKPKQSASAMPAKTPVEDAVDLPLANVIGIDTMKSDDDPQMCAPYASGIHYYLREMEKEEKRRPLPNYLEKVQKDISANMRGILVDWLVKVAEEYKLESDTLYLGVSYIDRYLSMNILNRKKLQLLEFRLNEEGNKEDKIITKGNLLSFAIARHQAATLSTIASVQAEDQWSVSGYKSSSNTKLETLKMKLVEEDIDDPYELLKAPKLKSLCSIPSRPKWMFINLLSVNRSASEKR